MALATRLSLVVTRIANYLRDSVLPRLIPLGGVPGQYLSPKASGSGWEWRDIPLIDSSDPNSGDYAAAVAALAASSANLRAKTAQFEEY